MPGIGLSDGQEDIVGEETFRLLVHTMCIVICACDHHGHDQSWEANDLIAAVATHEERGI